MTTSVAVRADQENNAEVWWDAFRAMLPALSEADPELYDLCRTLNRSGEVEITDPAAIERFDKFVSDLPGWLDGPAHARAALTFHAN